MVTERRTEDILLTASSKQITKLKLIFWKTDYLNKLPLLVKPESAWPCIELVGNIFGQKLAEKMLPKTGLHLSDIGEKRFLCMYMWLYTLCDVKTNWIPHEEEVHCGSWGLGFLTQHRWVATIASYNLLPWRFLESILNCYMYIVKRSGNAFNVCFRWGVVDNDGRSPHLL